MGDGEEELEAALREGLDADLLITSGGLGPTHDDRTVELLARVLGRPLRVDDDLHAQIEGVSRTVAERLRRPYADFEPGVRKQASMPEGAASVGLAGTAPGLVMDENGTRGRRPAGAARRAAAPLGVGARVRAGAAGARAGAPARAACAPILRRERIGRRAGARGGRRRAARGGGDDLRARLRDPRRPRRRSRERLGGGRARGCARRPGRALALRPRRAAGRGARPRALPCAGPDARDGRVVHGRDDRGAAHARAGLERRLSRRRSWRTRTR